MSPKVNIIILNWNGWRDTIECLRSLAKIDYQNIEIIVVDNGSTDDSVVRLEKFISHSDFRLKIKSLKLKDNLGFAGGNNIVLLGDFEINYKSQVTNSKPDYFLLLNNDTVVNFDFLSELVKVAEGDEKIGILGPMIYFYPPKFSGKEFESINSAGSKVNWLMNRGEYIGYGERDTGQFGDKPYKVDYISGACLLIKKDVVEKIGLLYENYFLYYEDTDWNFQARKIGYESVLVPISKIWHKESASAQKMGKQYVYYHARNGILFNKRCAPFYKRILIHFHNFYIFIKQIIKMFIPSKREWAKAVIEGIKDYYNGKFGKKTIANNNV